MDRNVKIALGCGGAGCLGLIVVMVAGVAIYLLRAPSSSTTNRNSNFNVNRNSRPDSSPGTNDNSDSNDNESSSSLSEDDQHKLFHAASVTSDREVIRRVSKKLGLLNSDNTPNEKNLDFATAHVGWVFRNTEFVQEINSPAKGRAYVDKHIND